MMTVTDRDGLVWMRLAALRPGAVFTTRDGVLAVKSRYFNADGGCQCVLLASGEFAYFFGFTGNHNDFLVRELAASRDLHKKVDPPHVHEYALVPGIGGSRALEDSAKLIWRCRHCPHRVESYTAPQPTWSSDPDGATR